MRTTQGEGCCRLSARESAGWHCFVLQLPKRSPTPSMRRHLRCPDQVLQPFSEAETRGICGLLGGSAVPSPMFPAAHSPGFYLCETRFESSLLSLDIIHLFAPRPGSPWHCSTVALPINNRPKLCPLSGLSWSV